MSRVVSQEDESSPRIRVVYESCNKWKAEQMSRDTNKWVIIKIEMNGFKRESEVAACIPWVWMSWIHNFRSRLFILSAWLYNMHLDKRQRRSMIFPSNSSIWWDGKDVCVWTIYFVRSTALRLWVRSKQCYRELWDTLSTIYWAIYAHCPITL